MGRHLCAWVVGLCAVIAGCSDDASSGGGQGTSGSSNTYAGQGSTTSSGDPALDDARQHCLDKINEYRAQANLAPYVLDDALNTFAQAASTQLSQDHAAHAYFSTNAAKCGCSINAETQGSPSGWPAAPVNTQIDQILAAMMKEGPGGGHHDAIVSPKYKRLGVGLVNPGAKLFFTNDFGQ